MTQLRGGIAPSIISEERMKTEWECIDMKCTHWDGDRCTLGFCEPDSPLYDEYLAWERKDSFKFEQSVTFREWFDAYVEEE